MKMELRNKTRRGKTRQGKKLKGRRLSSGFSLIEVMVSAAILGIGIAGLVQGLSSMQRPIAHQRKLTGAIHAAEAQMETLLMRQTNHADLTAGATHGPVYYDETGNEQVGVSTFAARWVVTADTPLPKVSLIILEVTWVEYGVQKSIRLSTHRSSL